MASNHCNVLFFDGVCNLCNNFVDFLIRHQRSNKVFFASLQGITAQKMLSEEQYRSLNTVVYHRNGKNLIKSQAALYVINDAVSWGFLLMPLLLFPRSFRDFVYDMVATRRYKIWGKRDSCRLPTTHEKSFFLD